MITSTATLLHALREGAVAITPNNRLSNQLLTDYYLAYGTNALPEKPRCLPYREFLKSLFANVCYHTPQQKHPLLLSLAQERHLWKQILSQQNSYTYHDGLLQEIQDAWRHCQHWQISCDDPAFMHTPQTRQFQQWQTLFHAQLHARQAITEAQLVDYLLQHEEAWLVPQHLIWACFDDTYPQQQVLQKAFTKQACLQEYYDLPSTSSEAYQYKARDPDDEWSKMVAWVKSRLAAGDQSIAMVIPNLQQVASALQRFLKQHFSDNAYNISLGKNLLQYPLVSHALEWLILDNTILTHHQAQLLLRSPYLYGSKHEFLARAQLMENNQLLREPLIDMDMFKSTVQQQTPKLAYLLQQLNDYPQVATGFEWVQQFKQRLSVFGFPGEYTLDSANYQCFQRLMTLFDEFMALTIVQKILTVQEALTLLHDLAGQTVFQLKQPKTAMVVTGLLEASGCYADSIWVAGLTDQCLPQPVRLSAFIPHSLQRQLSMPHAIAERELQIANQLIKRLQHGCQRIIFSYPSLTGDQPNLPSPLIAHHSLWRTQDNEDKFTPQTDTLLVSEEDYHIPLLPHEKIRGGSALLANQAQCPFKAFATHRLHAKAIETLIEGLDARERGQLTHRILECLWQQLKSQETLRALPLETLDQWLETIITTVLKSTLHKKNRTYPSWLQSIERDRLKHLIHAALAWEKQRPDFIIEALEQTYTLSLGGLSFQLRIDRIDRVKSTDSDSFENKLVIDYKTSLPSTKPWREERPEAPQLLLYALTDTRITTLIFAQLKSGQLTCQGFSDTTLPMDGIQTMKKGESWPDFQARWYQNLTILAEEFKQGECAPNPQKTSTCTSCTFQNLCRINKHID